LQQWKDDICTGIVPSSESFDAQDERTRQRMRCRWSKGRRNGQEIDGNVPRMRKRKWLQAEAKLMQIFWLTS